MFDPDKPITVETDASEKALGACLSQPGPKGKLQPVAYHSRKLSPPELNYDIHDKELLALVDAFRQWKVYLEGSKHTVQVFTDDKNLVYFTTSKELNRRQVRWYEEMATFNFRISYRKGSENDRADALSRRTDYMKGEVKQKQAILRQDQDGTMTVNRIAATFSVTSDALKDGIRTGLVNDATAKLFATILLDIQSSRNGTDSCTSRDCCTSPQVNARSCYRRTTTHSWWDILAKTRWSRRCEGSITSQA